MARAGCPLDLNILDPRAPRNPNNNLLGDPSQFNTGLQAQYTSLQPQFTSFNPYQQQAQQEAMQVSIVYDITHLSREDVHSNAPTCYACGMHVLNCPMRSGHGCGSVY